MRTLRALSGLYLAATPKPIIISRSAAYYRQLSTAGDQPHHDLPSFLAHAARNNLAVTSTIYVGTHYEYTVLRSLARLGLTLSRTGGRLDKGIDLLGTWHVPTLPREYPLRVLVQCKAISRKAGPNLIRELEGAFTGVPARWREVQDAVAVNDNRNENNDDGEDLRAEKEDGSAIAEEMNVNKASGTLALLVAPTEATKGVRDAMGRSRLPMAYAKVAQDGRVEQVLWNRSAAAKGLEGLGVSTRFKPKRMAVVEGGEAMGESLEQEVVLTWDGDVWEGPHVLPRAAAGVGKA